MPEVVTIPAFEIRCGDAFGDGQIVHAHNCNILITADSITRSPPDGAMWIEVGMQSPAGEWSNVERLVYDDPTELIRVVRGIPTPWQRAQGQDRTGAENDG